MAIFGTKKENSKVRPFVKFGKQQFMPTTEDSNMGITTLTIEYEGSKAMLIPFEDGKVPTLLRAPLGALLKLAPADDNGVKPTVDTLLNAMEGTAVILMFRKDGVLTMLRKLPPETETVTEKAKVETSEKETKKSR